MKTIGLLGGMTWLSTLEYYRIINETVMQSLGGFHSADCVIYSFDFDVIKKTHIEEDWHEATHLMIKGAQRLKSAGADFIIICTNTMHKIADEVQEFVKLPLLHITDVVAEAVKEKNLKKIGLLGTRFTMEQDFYMRRLKEKHSIETIVPKIKERKSIHTIINEELGKGKFTELSKRIFKDIIGGLVKKGASGIVLGCTEIPLLVKQEDYDIPIFNTTAIHAQAAVKYALDQQ